MLNAMVVLSVVILIVGIVLGNTPVAIGAVVVALLGVIRAVAEASRNEMEAMAELVKRIGKAS